jgi:hypothetical protein
MPEGDLKDLFRVVQKVSSSGWLRPLTAEDDAEELAEKYGARWRGAARAASPAPAPAGEGEGAEGDDDSRHISAGSSGRRGGDVAPAPEEAEEARLESEKLEELVREAERAHAASQAELEREEREAREAFEAAMPAEPAPATKPKHDSFSSIPADAASPSSSDGGERRPDAGEEAKVTIKSPPALVRVRAASLEKQSAPGSPVTPALSERSPGSGERSDRFFWNLGCFVGGFFGVLLLSRGGRRPKPRRGPMRGGATVADAEAYGVEVRTDVASPRILKEVFSP